jgi:TonB-dependent receptor
MQRFCSFLLALVFSLSLGLPALAQSGKGAVTGTVLDSGSSILSGALVELLPLGRKAVTDDTGKFRITDVPAGEYTLSVSYVGLAVSNVPVVVSAGQEVTANATLQVASQNDQVIVTAERLQGEAEAINVTRTNDNIVQVLPERVINSLPNTNIADAVGRVPSVSLERDEGEGKYVQIRGTEPRLTNVTVNGVNLPSPEGVVRQIKLDAVPADLVERIEVFKTLSADQDADGIGGTVNLVTRTSSERPIYAFGGTGGYNPIQNGYGRGGFNGLFGQRFGASKKFGFLINGTFDKTNRGIDDLEPGQTTGTLGTRNVAYANTEDQRSYNYYRTRYGFSTGIDYNIKPGFNVYAKGLYSDFHDYGEVWVYTPNSGNTIKSVSPDGKTVTFDNALDCQAVNIVADDPTQGGKLNANPCSPGSYNYRHYVRRPDQQLYSFLTGARHDFSSNLITIEFAGSRSHNIGGQDFSTTNFNGAAASYDATGHLLPGSNGADLAVSLANPFRPKFNALDNTSLFDPTQYLLANTSFTQYIAQQLNFQGAASFSHGYSVHSHLGTFSLGLKIRNSHSTQNENDQIYNYNGSAITLPTVLGTYTNPTYYDNFFRIGNQSYGPASNYNSIVHAVLPLLNDPTQFSLNSPTSIRRSAGAFFDANERIYAGYLMNVISIGKLRLETGVRFDASVTDFLTNIVTTNVDSQGNPLPPTVALAPPQSASYFNALPSIQAQYQLEKNTNLRLNFSQGLARPNVGDLVPTTVVDPNASPKTVTQGNPNLKPTKANNYDILLEHYFQPLGIIQGGYFYKQLSDPIYPTSSTILPGQPNAGFRLLQSINGPNAHIQGIELSLEQHFSFLPSFLNGLGLSANYSYTQSGVTFPTTFDGGRIDRAPLARQAPNTWNISPTYDKGRLSVRFAISHNDANIAFYNYTHVDAATDKDPILGLRGPGGDVYFYAHTQYDIQGSYRFAKGLSFEASGLNLSNEVFGFYQGSGIYPIQREYYKPTVSFGFRWTSSPE